ncbi:uncharacterized [Tachysurus ichikawai]
MATNIPANNMLLINLMSTKERFTIWSHWTSKRNKNHRNVLDKNTNEAPKPGSDDTAGKAVRTLLKIFVAQDWNRSRIKNADPGFQSPSNLFSSPEIGVQDL